MVQHNLLFGVYSIMALLIAVSMLQIPGITLSTVEGRSTIIVQPNLADPHIKTLLGMSPPHAHLPPAHSSTIPAT